MITDLLFETLINRASPQRKAREMPKRKRDYKAEYARRMARASAKGLSRSQARGHARPGETVGSKIAAAISDDRIQIALKSLRKEGSLSKAAKSAKVSPERLRKYAIERGVIEKSKGRWKVSSKLPRQMKLFSRGKQITVTVGDFESASLIGRYMSAVSFFLNTNNPVSITPFFDQSVVDIKGKEHPFEIRPNVL